MKKTFLVAALWASLAGAANAEPVDDPLDARIEISDVVSFYRIYDAANGRPSAHDLRSYVESPSAGVVGFIPNRIESAENLSAVIASQGAVYANARRCAERLGGVRERVRAAFLALEGLYPDARFADTFILIGANNSGGTANPDALMVGLEVVCRSDTPDSAPFENRLAHLITHEMIHSLQRGFEGDTILSQSLNEGAAELLAELVSGRIANGHLIEWTQGRELEIERRFQSEMRSRNLRNWLYNGVGTREAPGDLGYWVGYRIVRAYYERQTDKRRAVREILAATDAEAFLAESGWRP